VLKRFIGGQKTETTTAPVQTSPAISDAKSLTHAPPTRASWLDPEFVDCKGLEAAFGIKRGLAYALLADGKIQGVSLRRGNQIRGKRLFKVDSVRSFLNSLVVAGQ
jgi:hypothetical protein